GRLAARARRRGRSDPARAGAGARRTHPTAETVATVKKGVAERRRGKSSRGGVHASARRFSLTTFLDVFVLCIAMCGMARGQSKPGVIDRIVAVVGTRPILMSEVEEQVAQLQSQGQQLPSDSASLAKLRRHILDDMINEELEVQQAQRDTSIKVTEREVQDVVEQRVQSVRGQFSSEQEFINQLHLAAFPSAEEWRRYL